MKFKVQFMTLLVSLVLIFSTLGIVSASETGNLYAGNSAQKFPNGNILLKSGNKWQILDSTGHNMISGSVTWSSISGASILSDNSFLLGSDNENPYKARWEYRSANGTLIASGTRVDMTSIDRAIELTNGNLFVTDGLHYFVMKKDGTIVVPDTKWRGGDSNYGSTTSGFSIYDLTLLTNGDILMFNGGMLDRYQTLDPTGATTKLWAGYSADYGFALSNGNIFMGDLFGSFRIISPTGTIVKADTFADGASHYTTSFHKLSNGNILFSDSISKKWGIIDVNGNVSSVTTFTNSTGTTETPSYKAFNNGDILLYSSSYWERRRVDGTLVTSGGFDKLPSAFKELSDGSFLSIVTPAGSSGDKWTYKNASYETVANIQWAYPGSAIRNAIELDNGNILFVGDTTYQIVPKPELLTYSNTVAGLSISGTFQFAPGSIPTNYTLYLTTSDGGIYYETVDGARYYYRISETASAGGGGGGSGNFIAQSSSPNVSAAVVDPTVASEGKFDVQVTQVAGTVEMRSDSYNGSTDWSSNGTLVINGVTIGTYVKNSYDTLWAMQDLTNLINAKTDQTGVVASYASDPSTPSSYFLTLKSVVPGTGINTTYSGGSTDHWRIIGFPATTNISATQAQYRIDGGATQTATGNGNSFVHDGVRVGFDALASATITVVPAGGGSGGSGSSGGGNGGDPNAYVVKQRGISIPPTTNTWNTVLDYSGKGYLNNAYIYLEQVSGVTSTAAELRITVDGVVVVGKGTNPGSPLKATGVLQSEDISLAYDSATRKYNIKGSPQNIELYMGASTTGFEIYEGTEDTTPLTSISTLLSSPIYFNETLKIEVKGVLENYRTKGMFEYAEYHGDTPSGGGSSSSSAPDVTLHFPTGGIPAGYVAESGTTQGQTGFYTATIAGKTVRALIYIYTPPTTIGTLNIN